MKDTDSFDITVLLSRNTGSRSAAFATAAAKGSSSLSLTSVEILADRSLALHLAFADLSYLNQRPSSPDTCKV